MGHVGPHDERETARDPWPRFGDDEGRFVKAVDSFAGKRLTYDKLIGKIIAQDL